MIKDGNFSILKRKNFILLNMALNFSYSTGIEEKISDFAASTRYRHALIFSFIYNNITFFSFLFFLYCATTFFFYCFKGAFEDINLGNREGILKFHDIQSLKFLRQHFAFRLYPLAALAVYFIAYRITFVCIAVIFREIFISLIFDLACIIFYLWRRLKSGP